MLGSPTESRWKVYLGDLSLASSSPTNLLPPQTSFDESPSVRLGPRRQKDVPQSSGGIFSSWSGPTGRENAKTHSLTKLQLEKWNLQDQVKMLEAQVRSRDVLIQENQQLRDELSEAATERDAFKLKYTELAYKLSIFLKKEKADRKQVDSEISKTKMEYNSIELDRERILEEKNRVTEELESLKVEFHRLKDSFPHSVDRESFERQKQDILQENSQLRLMLEDSIPKCLYQRLEHQLTETIASASTHGASMREMQIDNQRLLTKLNAFEVTEVQNSTRLLELEKELKHTQEALSSARRQLLAEKDSLQEKYEKTIGELQQQLVEMGKRCKLAEESSATVDVASRVEQVVKQVVCTRESLGALKVEFLNMKRSIANAVFKDIEKIVGFHHRILRLVGHDIECILAESGLYESTPQVEFSETLEALREFIVKLSKEWKSSRQAVDAWASEAEALKVVVSEKDSIIDGLALRLSHFDKAKRTERATIARLRDSIESAERKLNESRLQD